MRLTRRKPETFTPEDKKRRRKVIAACIGTVLLLPFLGLVISSCTRQPTSPENEGEQPASPKEQEATTDGNVVSNQPTLAQTDDITIPRDCILSRLLDRICPNWVRWEDFPNYGDGIWSIPRRISNGLCHIYVNGEVVSGTGINVDTIQLQAGDTLAIRPAVS